MVEGWPKHPGVAHADSGRLGHTSWCGAYRRRAPVPCILVWHMWLMEPKSNTTIWFSGVLEGWATHALVTGRATHALVEGRGTRASVEGWATHALKENRAT
eukprot:190991-Chlamydomonas_euryale.AAC.1